MLLQLRQLQEQQQQPQLRYGTATVQLAQISNPRLLDFRATVALRDCPVAADITGCGFHQCPSTDDCHYQWLNSWEVIKYNGLTGPYVLSLIDISTSQKSWNATYHRDVMNPPWAPHETQIEHVVADTVADTRKSGRQPGASHSLQETSNDPPNHQGAHSSGDQALLASPATSRLTTTYQRQSAGPYLHFTSDSKLLNQRSQRARCRPPDLPSTASKALFQLIALALFLGDLTLQPGCQWGSQAGTKQPRLAGYLRTTAVGSWSCAENIQGMWNHPNVCCTYVVRVSS